MVADRSRRNPNNTKSAGGEPKQSGGLFWRGEPSPGVPRCEAQISQFSVKNVFKGLPDCRKSPAKVWFYKAKALPAREGGEASASSGGFFRRLLLSACSGVLNPSVCCADSSPRRGAKLPATSPYRIHDRAEKIESSDTAPIRAAPACLQKSLFRQAGRLARKDARCRFLRAIGVQGYSEPEKTASIRAAKRFDAVSLLLLCARLIFQLFIHRCVCIRVPLSTD